MAINWNPTAAAEIQQTVRTLLATAPGSVPLARRLGIPQDVIDMPQSLAAQRLRAGIISAFKVYEPRVALSRVAFTTDEVGALRATVEVKAA